MHPCATGATCPLVAVPRPLDKLAEECKELELNTAKMSTAHGDLHVRITEVIVERVDSLVDQLHRQFALAGAGAAGASVPDSSASNPSSDPKSSKCRVAAPELGSTPSADDDAAVVHRYFSDTKIFGEQLTRRYAANPYLHYYPPPSRTAIIY
jgi:hypothetical protein